MKKLKLAILLILTLVLVLLVVQNTASVQAHFLGFTTEMSLVVLLFLTGAIGFVSGLVLGFLLKSKRSKSVKQQQEVQ
ncbi:MAG: LapA family protein [Balneolaceae bacterium]|nr:LapA family protein [Balneolaceae bacterium]